MHKDEQARLAHYLSIKSVANTDGIKEANSFISDWLATFCDSVQSIGNVNPLIRAYINGNSNETLCLYGHYDVQPALQSDGWDSNPFQPVVTKEIIVARGACDNKGQHYAFLIALERLVRAGKRPCHNVLILLDGEEEIGSPHLKEYLLQNRVGNRADHYLLVDGTSPIPERPAIYTGSLGVVFGEILVDNQLGDLHSGVFGIEAAQPIGILVPALQALYDNKIGLDLNDVEQWSFSVNYLSAGSDPAKSIIPGKALATISYRFSHGIEPVAIINAINRHCSDMSQKHNVDVTFTPKVIASASEAKRGTLFKQCADSLEQIGLKHCSGRLQGTLPVASAIRDIYQADSLIVSFGSKDNHTHGVNERMAKSSIEHSITFFGSLLT